MGKNMSSKLQEDGVPMEPEAKKTKKKSSKTKDLLTEGMAEVMKKKKKSTKTKKSHREEQPQDGDADNNNLLPPAEPSKKKKKSKRDKDPQPQLQVIAADPEPIIEEEHDSQFKGHNQSQQLEHTESQAQDPEVAHESPAKDQDQEPTNEELLPPKAPKKKAKKSHKKSRKS